MEGGRAGGDKEYPERGMGLGQAGGGEGKWRAGELGEDRGAVGVGERGERGVKMSVPSADSGRGVCKTDDAGLKGEDGKRAGGAGVEVLAGREEGWEGGELESFCSRIRPFACNLSMG